MKEYVCGFLIDPNSRQAVLIQKNKPDWQRGLLNGVGGKIEPGEAPKKAMMREFEEEAGELIEDWEETVILCGPDYQVHFFRSFGSVESVRSMTDESLYIMNIGEVWSLNTIENIRWILPMQLDNLRWPVTMLDAHETEAAHAFGNAD
jgi:8-oxo-dGTP diphosphatase